MQGRTAIITRTKNRNALLPRAIESVLGQGCADWIHVIVNDGGDREAVERLVERYRERYRGRLLVIHHDVSLGMEAASNRGIAAVDSRFVLIHDDDDSLHPEFLATTAALLEQPPFDTVRAVATHALRVDEVMRGDRAEAVGSSLFRDLGPLLSLVDVANTNPCPPISFLFRRDSWEEIGRFDESLPVLGDWDFLLRLVGRYDVCVVQRPLANYHIRPALAGGDYSNTVTAGLDRHRLYDTRVRNRYAREGANPTLALLLQAYASSARGGGALRLLDRIDEGMQFVRTRMPLSLLRLLVRRLKRLAGRG